MQLNCDMGESFGNWEMGQDEAVMPYINQANIACGFHASDPLNMDKTIKLATENLVSIGAHPGYADLIGFGRRSIPCSDSELRSLLLYQIGAINALCQANQTQLDYVKPHGALYNDMMQQEPVFINILQALSLLEPTLPLMIQAGLKQNRYQQLADDKGIPLLFEAFIDRRYQDDGGLMPRSKNAAVLHSKHDILDQAKNLTQGFVYSNSGKKLSMNADSLCIHGDNADSVSLIHEIAILLKQNHAPV